MKTTLLLPLLSVIAACLPVGPTARRLANSADGIYANVQLAGRPKVRFAGELLAVRDSTLLLLREDDEHVVEVPIRAIRYASFQQHGTLIDGGNIERRDREKLRLMSRFPGGVSPELEARLLEAYGQTEPERPGQP